MNLLALAERMGPADRPPVVLDAHCCVHTRDRFSKCDACVGACPTGALRSGEPVALHMEACTACGACLPVCPAGALSGDDGIGDLMTCVSRLNPSILELACVRHPAPENGETETATVIRTDHCLAAFGASVYLWLLGGDVKRVILRLDACAACTIGKAQPQIMRTLAAARHLLSAKGMQDRLVEIKERNEGATKARPVQSAKNPPLSRRDLFRALASEGPKLAAQILPGDDAPVQDGKTPPRERRQLLNALRRLAMADPTILSALALEGNTGIVRLGAKDSCNACGACARICPTGAIECQMKGEDFNLLLTPGACTDCGACLDVCEPAALYRQGTPSLGEFLGSEPIRLRAESLRKCQRCGAQFAGATGSDLCPTCEFRRQNPFGSQRPARG